MKLSTRGRYAVRALMHLAENYGKGSTSIKEISERESISVKYLANIIPLMIKSGIVKSRKGKGGGFELAREPKKITLYDILVATERFVSPIHCVKDETECPNYPKCKAKYVWKGLSAGMEEYMKSHTLYEMIGGEFQQKIIDKYMTKK